MKKFTGAIVIALLAATLISAADIVPFRNITSAKIKGCINAVMYGDNPSCYPGPINVTIGAIDYTEGLSMMVDPLSETAIWQTVAGTLAPGALTFDFETATTIDGADVTVAVPGDPWEKDITGLMQQIVADGNSSGKAYAFCVMTTGGAGKINLLSTESSTNYAQLVNIEVVDANGTHVFKYKKSGGAPANNLGDRIQYTGTRCAMNQAYSDAFVVGGHEGAASGSYMGQVEDRCAFIFHSGLAANLGWTDPNYSDVVAIEKTNLSAKTALSLQNMPNPFTGSTRISYTLDKNVPVQLGVYDVTGKLVKSLVCGVQTAGAYSVSWNGKNAPMGMYVLRLKAGERTLNRKMLVIK